MKRLVLIRHAKSSWEYNVPDFNRSLKEKGIKRAEKMSILLQKTLDFTPELWESSFANRALHTATIFARNFDRLNEIKINQKLYTFNYQDLHQEVQSIPNKFESAILFGHNEAITDFANCNGSLMVENIPTAGIVVIHFPVDSWAKINKGKTEYLWIPNQVL